MFYLRSCLSKYLGKFYGQHIMTSVMGLCFIDEMLNDFQYFQYPALVFVAKKQKYRQLPVTLCYLHKTRIFPLHLPVRC